jgi:hypothetical protein
MAHTCHAPVRLVKKAMLLPSGDHAGETLLAGLAVGPAGYDVGAQVRGAGD